MKSQDHITLTETFSAHNYKPLPCVLAEGQGSWVTDVDNNRYLDMLCAYSAVNFGHSHPRLIAAAKRQLDRITLTSRAFFNDQLGLFCKELADLCGYESVLAMNSGAEAVETALKIARRWGYQEKGIPPESAEIICFNNNFHGRTISIVSFSTETAYRQGFGPFTPGFRMQPFGDIEAVRGAINKNTAAVLFEPIQGEGGIIVPPQGFLKDLADVCSKNNVLLIADEIQTGLCRTGKLLCSQHDQIAPDLVILGKALGGSIVPISAVLGRNDVMKVIDPGSHGSTFGGNPFACAIAREVIALIKDEVPENRATLQGQKLVAALRSMQSPIIQEVRGKGLLIGIDIAPEFGVAKDYCKKLLTVGVLCKDTREQTIRLAPSLFISDQELDWGLEKIQSILLQ